MRGRSGCPFEVDVERDEGPGEDADALGEKGATGTGTEAQGEVPWFTGPALQQGRLFGDIMCRVGATRWPVITFGFSFAQRTTQEQGILRRHTLRALFPTRLSKLRSEMTMKY